MKNAYQKNLTSPVVKQDQENKWYSGSQPTFGETLGQIMKVSLEDPVRGQDLQNRMQMRMEDPTSSFYQPYAKATNRSVANLASYGIDTSRMDDKWFADNDYLLGYLRYDGKTNTPSTPKKNASDAEKAAYEYYQIKISEDATRKVETQWNALQEELSYWANRKDRNLSDDQIIDNIDWSKYGALDDLQKKYEQGKPVELNRGTTFSRDALRGVIWAARNNGGTGNIYQDMARSAVGDGVTWQANDDIASRLDPMSQNFNPYSVGSTVDEAALYFGVPSFGKNWLKDNNGLQWSDDETERKMYQQVQKAEENTVKAEQQLDELYSFIDKKINRGKSADKILDSIDWSQYSMLTEMDKSMGTEDEPGNGKLIQFTRAIDYKLSDLKKYINEGCEKYAARKKELEYASALQTAANTPASDLDAVTGVMPSYTEQQAAVVAEQNKTLADAADLIDAGGTPSEKTASQNLWDASFDTIRSAVQNIKDSAKASGTVMYEQTVRKNIGTMSSAMLADADTVQTFNIYQQDVYDLLKKKVQIEAQVGDSKEYLAAGKFNPRIVDEEGNLSLSGQAGWDLLSDEEKGYLETVLYYASENPDESMDILADSYNKYLANHITAGDDTINEYRDIVNELDYKEKFLEANQELVAEANANTESAIQQYDALISMMKNAGGDTTELENARQATEFLLNFTKYNPTKWESYNVYDEYSKAAISGMEGFDEMYAFAEQTDKELLENIEVGEWILEYADRVGMEMPDSIRTNVTRWVNALKRQHEDFEYLSVLKNEDREETVAKGREMGAETAEFDWDVYDGTLESQPAWDLLTEKQKETLLSMQNVYDIYDVVNQMHAYLGGADIENRMFGTYRMRDLLTDYEKETFYYLLAKEGLEGANAYIDHLADASYGVLNSRAADKTRESADALAGSGIWGRRAADALSMLLSPVAAVGSMYYMAETGLAKLRGEDVEFNPNNVNLSANIYKKEARQKIQEEIAKTYGKDTVLGKFMSGLQEIISNRGDSMMNMLAFGPLFNDIGSKMLNEFVSAAPMAFTAATDAVAEAKENGAADDMQLLGIFAATFLAEAGTEAISIDNMREAFGMGQDITGRGIKDFLKNWLTKAGISEMFGESLNDVIENAADEIFMGENSEFEKNVQQYMTDEHMSREDAELAARRDQMMGVLHTALISYLSPGMDVGSYLTGNLKGYRGMTKDLQKAGYNVSILDVMRMDKEQRNKAQQKATETETASAAEQTETQTEEQTEVQNAEPEEGTATIVSEKGETLGTPKTAEEQIATEYQVLDNASDANSTSQTATIAGVLDVYQTDASADVAKATAAKLGDTLKGLKFRGQEINPVEFIKNLWIGASETKTDLNTLKTAIQNAVLGGEESAAYEQLTRAKFRKADFDAQVQRLADTVAVDAANSAVQANIANAVRENRVAEAEGIIIGSGEAAKGAVKAAQKAQQTADKAVRTTQRVQDDLTAKQNQREAAAKAVQEASAQFTQNPSTDNKNAMIQAIGKLNSASEVVKEYEQSLAKAQADQRTAEANAQTARDDALLQIRQQAEEMVNQEDQRRAGVQQELMAQEQQAMAQMAEQQRIEDERSGKADEQRTDALIEDILNSEHLEGQQREDRRFALQQRAEQIKMGRIDMSGLMNNTEGYLAVSALSRKLGIGIQLSSEMPANARGMYANGTVYLNQNLIKNGKMTIGQALVEASLHEITHAMENTKSYQAYSKVVMDSLFNGDEAALNAAIDQKIADYKNSVGQNLTREDAQKEIIADFARTKLNGKEVVQRFMDAGLGGKMRNALHNINQAIKNFRLTGEEKKTAEYLRKAERAFQKAINEVTNTATHPEGTQFSINQFAEAAGMSFDTNTLELRDTEGNLIDGVNNKVTADMMNGTPVGMLIDLAQNGAKTKKGVDKFAPTISAETAQAQKQMFADLMNMVAQYKDSDLVWEIASSTLFSAMKANSDPQYSTTVDFGTVCAKTQEIINVMSKVMLEKGRGLTRQEVLKVYNETANAGLTVPCPVCYVFSRWMGVPSLLNQMSQYQKRFVITNADGTINIENTQAAADEYIQQALSRYGEKKNIDKAKTSITNKMKTQEKNRVAALQVLTDENATEKAKTAAQKKHDTAIAKLDSLTKDLGEVEAYNWVTQALCTETEDGKFVVDPEFRVTPDEILFDLNKTGEFAKDTKNWTYRNTRGAGMGKAIMPYSGDTIGDIVYGVKSRAKVQNPFLTQNPDEAAEGIKNAIIRARKQNLIGGQRLQSTSDFRPEWGLDYMMAFLELQAVGSKVQMYTKVAEAVDLLASMGGDINLSIMGQGKGWHEDENGNKVLDFSDVTGMKYETAKELKDKYDNVQMILVGMNDTHIRLAMADKDIDFIIPWHSSGNSKDALASMISSVGESLETSSDYTDYQTDKAAKGQTVEQKNLWNLRMKILQGKEITAEERDTIYHDKYLKNLYDRFNVEGVDADCYQVELGQDQAKQIFPYEYWDKSLTKDQADQNGKNFVDYCEHFGMVPRFSQFKDDTGYWKLLIDRPMYDNAGNYRDQQVVDVTKAKVGSINEGKLTNSDMPLKTSAMYGPNYSEQEKNAVDNTLAALDEQAGMNGGQYSVFGDELTDADLEQLLTMDEINHDYVSPDGDPVTNDAVEKSDVKVQYSVRTAPAPQKTIKAYKAFYARDGKLYPPMVSNNTNEEDMQKITKATSGTMKGLETPVGVWLDADVGGLAVDENGEPLRTKSTNRLQVKNSKSGGNATLAFRPGWHLGEWPDATQFYKDNPETGEKRSLMPDDLVFAECEIAADIDYQLEALELGVTEKGGFNRTQAGLPRVPVDGYYKYRTNANPKEAPWYISGAMKVTRILTDEECREVCAEHGVTPAERYSHHDIDLSDYGLTAGEVTPTDNLERFAKNKASYDNDALLERALNDERYSNAYVRRSLNFDDPTLLNEFAIDRISDDQVEKYRSEYKGVQYSTEGESTTADLDNTLLSSGIVSQEDMDAYAGPQRQFGSMTAQKSDELSEQVKQYLKDHSDYIPDSNAEQIDRSISWIRSNADEADKTGYYNSLRKVTGKNFRFQSADGQARMLAVMGMAIAKGDVESQVAIADAYNKQGTTLGQALQARKIFRLMTPEGRISTLQKMLQNTQDEINAKGTNVELKFSDWIYRAAAAATEEGDFAKVQQAAAAELAQQLPASWKDKLRSFRMFSMLANPRTHIRNIIGNMLFVPSVSLKNKLGALAEIVTHTNERTKTLSPFLNSEIREFARQDAKVMKDTLTGEAKYNELNAVDKEKKAFKGLMQAAMDFNSNMLEKEDWFFLKGHYRRALGGWMQANGYTVEQVQNDASLLEKGRAYAIEEAQKATYRDFNKLAATLNQVSKQGGVGGFLVDATLPFKKTPANILRRGVEYSPVGIMRSLTTDLYHLKQYLDYQNGKLNALPEKAISPVQFIDHICSGLSGTAVLAAGAILANAGIVTCGLGDDDDELEKAKGAQKYSIKILGTDMTFTMDWAAPMSMPFFVGAAVRDELAKDGDVNIDKLIDAFGNITEPVFNLSMLDGINTLFKTSQYDDTNTLTQIGAKIASNYVTSYVPSLAGAIARTIDDKQRKAFVESGKGTGVTGTFRYAVEQTENKIPGLNQTNIATRDVWGNEKTTGLAERILENFILPGYVENYNDDPLLNELGRLYDATGDDGMIPSDPGKTISRNNQSVALTAEQWDTYKTARGQQAYKDLTELFMSEEYRKADPMIQAQMVNEVWKYATSIGKQAVFSDIFVEPKSVEDIIHTGTVTGYKNEMMKALKVGDIDTFDDMVEALREQDVSDSDIKNKIAGTYRDQYKEAYIMDDYETMNMIEDLLDDTGFKFDLDAWEEQADKKYNN